MALINKRLEMMRQISKGPAKVESPKLIHVLVEVETGQVMGTYHDETLAETDSDAIYGLYRIDTEIKSFPIDVCPDLVQLSKYK